MTDIRDLQPPQEVIDSVVKAYRINDHETLKKFADKGIDTSALRPTDQTVTTERVTSTPSPKAPEQGFFGKVAAFGRGLDVGHPANWVLNTPKMAQDLVVKPIVKEFASKYVPADEVEYATLEKLGHAPDDMGRSSNLRTPEMETRFAELSKKYAGKKQQIEGKLDKAAEDLISESPLSVEGIAPGEVSSDISAWIPGVGMGKSDAQRPGVGGFFERILNKAEADKKWAETHLPKAYTTAGTIVQAGIGMADLANMGLMKAGFNKPGSMAPGISGAADAGIGKLKVAKAGRIRSAATKDLMELTGDVAPQVGEAIVTRPEKVLEAYNAGRPGQSALPIVKDMEKNMTDVGETVGKAVGQYRDLIFEQDATKVATQYAGQAAKESMQYPKLPVGEKEIQGLRDFVIPPEDRNQVKEVLNILKAKRGGKPTYEMTPQEILAVTDRIDEKLRPVFQLNADGSSSIGTSSNLGRASIEALKTVRRVLKDKLHAAYPGYAATDEAYSRFKDAEYFTKGILQSANRESKLANIFGQNKTEALDLLSQYLDEGKNLVTDMQTRLANVEGQVEKPGVIKKGYAEQFVGARGEAQQIGAGGRESLNELSSRLKDSNQYLEDLANRLAGRALYGLRHGGGVADVPSDKVRAILQRYESAGKMYAQGAGMAIGGAIGGTPGGIIGAGLGHVAAPAAGKLWSATAGAKKVNPLRILNDFIRANRLESEGAGLLGKVYAQPSAGEILKHGLVPGPLSRAVEAIPEPPSFFGRGLPGGRNMRNPESGAVWIGRANEEPYRSTIYLSPNQRTGVGLPETESILQSRDFETMTKDAKSFFEKKGLKAEITPAEGTWKDPAVGIDAEPSWEVSLTGGTKEQHDAAVWEALLRYNQKSALTFHEGREGPDIFYTIKLPADSVDMVELRHDFDNAGIEAKTILRKGPHVEVKVLDSGGQQYEPQLQAIGEKYQVPIEARRGSGDFKGGNTREETAALAKTELDNFRGATGGGNNRPIQLSEAVKAEYPSGIIGRLTEAKDVPPFYSQLERVAQEKVGGSITKSQLIPTLKAAGVKDEEIQWVLRDLPEGKISKKDLMDAIAANKIQVEEVVKGNPAKFDDLPPDWQPRMGADGMWEVSNPRRGSLVARGRTPEEATQNAQLVLADHRSENPTMFHNYQTPGGENYRELLLKLPEGSTKQAPTFEEWYQKTHTRPLELAMSNPTWREIVLKQYEADAYRLARNPDAFTNSHWKEPNVLAHVRFNEREINGKKVLFIEEIQSDWHQKGRAEGYASGGHQTELRAAEKAAETAEKDMGLVFADIRRRTPDMSGLSDSFLASGTRLGTFRDGLIQPDDWVLMQAAVENRDQAFREVQRISALANRGVPDAPFKKTWQELAMKRMFRWAAENGFDEVAWTTGKTQNDRYNLAKYFNNIVADQVPQESGPPVYDIWGTKTGETRGMNLGMGVTEEKLPEFVGKDLANKIISDGGGEYKGVDLEIGGEGMKGFYDKMLVDFANKYAKKWGAKVRTIVPSSAKIVPHPEYPGRFSAIQDGAYILAGNGRPVTWTSEESGRNALSSFMEGAKKDGMHIVSVTPEMKSEVMKKGQPLFVLPWMVGAGLAAKVQGERR